jgi:hypothetical protein
MIFFIHRLTPALSEGEREMLQTMFLYLSIFSIAFLFIGLYKPWMMLWWQAVQNRRRVIKLYGGVALVSYALYWLMFFIL